MQPSLLRRTLLYGGFEEIPIEAAHVLAVAQAEREGLLLITANTLLGPLSGSGAPSGQLLSEVQACVVACRSVRLQERFLRGGQQRTTAVNAARPHLS